MQKTYVELQKVRTLLTDTAIRTQSRSTERTMWRLIDEICKLETLQIDTDDTQKEMEE